MKLHNFEELTLGALRSASNTPLMMAETDSLANLRNAASPRNTTRKIPGLCCFEGDRLMAPLGASPFDPWAQVNGPSALVRPGLNALPFNHVWSPLGPGSTSFYLRHSAATSLIAAGITSPVTGIVLDDATMLTRGLWNDLQPGQWVPACLTAWDAPMMPVLPTGGPITQGTASGLCTNCSTVIYALSETPQPWAATATLTLGSYQKTPTRFRADPASVNQPTIIVRLANDADPDSLLSSTMKFRFTL